MLRRFPTEAAAVRQTEVSADFGLITSTIAACAYTRRREMKNVSTNEKRRENYYGTHDIAS
ncbi:hypothetical protein GCM10022269_13080 [Sphingorhabdus rigui]